MTKRGYLLITALLVLVTNASALAAPQGKGPELRLGLLAHSVGPASDGIESGADINLELLLAQKVGRHFLWGRGMVGANLSLRGDTSQVYTGRAWQFGLPWSFELEYQFGVVLHNGERNSKNSERRQLGTRLLLRNALELGWRWDRYRLSAIYDHASNADLAGDRNQGLDDIGLRLSIDL